MKYFSLTTLLVVLLGFSGCLSPQPEKKLTQEEIQAQEQFKRQLMAQLSQKMQGSTQQPSLQQQEQNYVTKSYITNDDLLQKFNSFPKNGTNVKFTKLKDGFSINDSARYTDQEGEIVNFGYDWKNGNVTYLVSLSPDTYKIKYTQAMSGKEAIDIAEVSRVGKQYTITTATGKKITSNGLILTSTGFIAVREESAFVYNIGNELYTFYAPQGWHIAKFQNGDVASTKFILLERSIEGKSSNKANPLVDFIEATKELTALAGITDKQDYMLINLYDSNKKYLFDITLGDKESSFYSQCKKTSNYIAKCDSVTMKETLYKQNNLPNTGHYYWTILWFSTPDGAMAATREKVQTKVILTDLISSKKVEAAFRLTGFPELSAEQDKNGKIKIKIGGGYLADVVIEDANKFLQETPDMTMAQADKKSDSK